MPLPHQCQLCLQALPARQPISLCRQCESDLPWLAPGCPRCGLASTAILPGAGQCAACTIDPPPFYHCRGLFDFAPPVDDMIRHFKDNEDFAAGKALARLLSEQFVRHHQEFRRPLPSALIPVPLSARRLADRGFNQAMMLTQAVSRYSAVPLLDAISRRTQSAIDQRGLGRTARQHNMQDAFEPAAARRLTVPEHVAIIDDVVTTGATASALARLLHRHGAHFVDVWCLARVEPPD
ncbi:MAG: ComF family protein [Pseudohongiellaceae bacterium]